MNTKIREVTNLKVDIVTDHLYDDTDVHSVLLTFNGKIRSRKWRWWHRVGRLLRQPFLYIYNGEIKL